MNEDIRTLQDMHDEMVAAYPRWQAAIMDIGKFKERTVILKDPTKEASELSAYEMNARMQFFAACVDYCHAKTNTGGTDEHTSSAAGAPTVGTA